jgi:hypothetical protein
MLSVAVYSVFSLAIAAALQGSTNDAMKHIQRRGFCINKITKVRIFGGDGVGEQHKKPC